MGVALWVRNLFGKCVGLVTAQTEHNGFSLALGLAQAHELLSKDDVTVTNQSDKDEQLPKILRLDERVRARDELDRAERGLRDLQYVITKGLEHRHLVLPGRAN